jgi:tRNA threonylcarbamoyladenosine biosynthesis protein TsaE
MSLNRWQTQTGSPLETRRLGELIGRLADAGQVFLLSGELGAGKTCFAQGVARGLGVSSGAPVTSPSYSLMNIHRGRIPFYHFDLYRLSRVDDLADLGYDEFAEGDGLTLVEWADRMTDELTSSLAIFIDSLAGQQRRFRFEARDGRGRALLEQLDMQWPPHDGPSGTQPRENL